MKTGMTLFENYQIHRIYDEDTEIWWFSIIDIVQVLTQQSNFQATRNYWKLLKNRLKNEGSEVVTHCNQLKITATDDERQRTDARSNEALLRLEQAIPSPKSEPIKIGLSKMGHKRMPETVDPAISLNRARESWQKHVPSRKWFPKPVNY